MIKIGLYSEDRTLHPLLSSALGKEFQVLLQSDQQGMNDLVSAGECDVMILDLNSNHESLQERIGFSRQLIASRVPSVVMADDGLRSTAFELVRTGAFGYCRRPPSIRDLKTMLSRAYENSLLKRQVEAKQQRMEDPGACDRLIGSSRPMQQVYQMVHRVTNLNAAVLVTGESGTGKELIARAIHNMGTRSKRPFVAVSCGAIPETLIEAELFGHEKGAFTGTVGAREGYFEQAADGTLFLDEIGELTPLLQAKLLRVLEDQVIRRVGGLRDMQVDVRVIAASNRDLEKAVREGQFRQDLYYRLAIIAIFIPPLRDRKEDIVPLVNFFIERYNRRFKKSIRGITDETRSLMLAHNWPGNVRELKNTIERGMILEDEPFLRPIYLPFSVGESGGRTLFERTSPADGGQTLPNGRTLPRLYIPEGGTSLEEVEHSMVELAMSQANGNQTNAAKLLDISRDALRYKLKKFGLSRPEDEL